MTEKLALVPVKTLRKFLFLDSTHKQCLNVLPLPVLVFNKHTFHHHHHHFPMGIRTYLMVNCLKTISILLEDHQMNMTWQIWRMSIYSTWLGIVGLNSNSSEMPTMFSWMVANFCFPAVSWCAGVKVIMSCVVPFSRKFKSSVILSNMLWSSSSSWPRSPMGPAGECNTGRTTASVHDSSLMLRLPGTVPLG